MRKLNYNKKFYEQQKASNISSADYIVPIIIELLGGGGEYSVIDLGCGSGNWLSVFKRYGWKVIGVDGGDVPKDILMIERNEFVKHDFREKYVDTNRYSLSISLECAEHIPEDSVDDFLDSLTSLSNVVLFSAAIPHQRGKGHINEQYPSYWIGKFEQLNYQVLDIIRPKVWKEKSVRGFYAQNMFLYVNRESDEWNRLSYLVDRNNPEMFDLVHPETWEKVNSFKLVKLMDVMHENKFVSWVYYKFFKNK